MFEIRDVKEQVMIQWDSQIIGQSFDVPAGHGQVDFTCDAFPFLDGAYSWWPVFGTTAEGSPTTIASWQRASR